MSKIAALTPRRTLKDASDVDWFWGIVDRSIADDEDIQLSQLTAQFAGLPDQDVVDFIFLFRGVHDGLYSWRLWAAGYLINGGCSDDGFHYFRSWLISRGRTIIEHALADIDSLADVDVEPDAASFEHFEYAMTDVYRDRANGAFPKIKGEGLRQGIGNKPGEPDWEFNFDDAGEMRRRLPRLAAKFMP